MDARSLAVVGIVEVLGHIPRIYGEFRKLVRAAKTRRPDLAILTDSPDFHLRLAKKLHALGVPVVYLIAPQAWAWRQGRVKTMRRTLTRLLCIFPFEEAVLSGARGSRDLHRAPAGADREAVADARRVLRKIRARGGRPGGGPAARQPPRRGRAPHAVPAGRGQTVVDLSGKMRFILALPAGFGAEHATFWEPARAASIQVIEGLTWDCLASRGGRFGGERYGNHRGSDARHTHGDLLSGKRVKLEIGPLDGEVAVPVDGESGGRAAG